MVEGNGRGMSESVLKIFYKRLREENMESPKDRHHCNCESSWTTADSDVKSEFNNSTKNFVTGYIIIQ
jgi:hypothetical protein